MKCGPKRAFSPDSLARFPDAAPFLWQTVASFFPWARRYAARLQDINFTSINYSVIMIVSDLSISIDRGLK